MPEYATPIIIPNRPLYEHPAIVPVPRAILDPGLAVLVRAFRADMAELVDRHCPPGGRPGGPRPPRRQRWPELRAGCARCGEEGHVVDDCPRGA